MLEKIKCFNFSCIVVYFLKSINKTEHIRILGLEILDELSENPFASIAYVLVYMCWLECLTGVCT